MADVNKAFENLQMSLVTSWTGVRTAMDFFMQETQRQARRVEALNALNQEKDTRITMLTRRVTKLESEVADVRKDNTKLKAAMKTGLEGVINQRKQLEAAEAEIQKENAEKEVLRIKLAGAEQRAAATNPIGFGLAQQQIECLETAINAAAEARATLQQQAFHESKENLENALAASQARVQELEEQLRPKFNAPTPGQETSDQFFPSRPSSSMSHFSTPSPMSLTHALTPDVQPRPPSCNPSAFALKLFSTLSQRENPTAGANKAQAWEDQLARSQKRKKMEGVD